jgi:hypothetical protein
MKTQRRKMKSLSSLIYLKFKEKGIFDKRLHDAGKVGLRENNALNYP